MKKIGAIIRHFKLDEVKQALVDCDLFGTTVTEVSGFGQQRGHKETYRGTEYTVEFNPKIKIEVAVHNDHLQTAVDAIVTASRTGDVGDGKVFVSELCDAIRIRTSESGDAAL